MVCDIVSVILPQSSLHKLESIVWRGAGVEQKRLMGDARVSAVDNEAKIRNAIVMLMRIVNDASVPRNIRRVATEAINQLRQQNLSYGVRAANAIHVLDEISQDPNMPVHTRIAIWNIVSLLETVRD